MNAVRTAYTNQNSTIFILGLQGLSLKGWIRALSLKYMDLMRSGQCLECSDRVPTQKTLIKLNRSYNPGSSWSVACKGTNVAIISDSTIDNTKFG